MTKSCLSCWWVSLTLIKTTRKKIKKVQSNEEVRSNLVYFPATLISVIFSFDVIHRCEAGYPAKCDGINAGWVDPPPSPWTEERQCKLLANWPFGVSYLVQLWSSVSVAETDKPEKRINEDKQDFSGRVPLWRKVKDTGDVSQFHVPVLIISGMDFVRVWLLSTKLLKYKDKQQYLLTYK